MRWLVEALIYTSLRRAFGRVVWCGPPPNLPTDRAVVLYATHHTFYDGYLMWLLIRRHLGRAPMTWMREWDRFPFFAAVGAQPFPADDAKRRGATVRRTIRRFRSDPQSTLVYFPEGHQHPPEQGVAPFSADELARLDRLLPNKVWWPVGIHLTWREGSKPVALLGGGAPHDRVDGGEHERLEAVWGRLQAPDAATGDAATLLGDAAPPHERWGGFFGRPFWEQYL